MCLTSDRAFTQLERREAPDNLGADRVVVPDADRDRRAEGSLVAGPPPRQLIPRPHTDQHHPDPAKRPPQLHHRATTSPINSNPPPSGLDTQNPRSVTSARTSASHNGDPG